MSNGKSAAEIFAENQIRLKQLFERDNLFPNTLGFIDLDITSSFKSSLDLIDNAINQIKRDSFTMLQSSFAINDVAINISNQFKNIFEYNQKIQDIYDKIAVEAVHPLIDSLDAIEEEVNEQNTGMINGEKLNFTEIKNNITKKPTWKTVLWVLDKVVFTVFLNMITPNPDLDKVLENQETIIRNQNMQIELQKEHNEQKLDTIALLKKAWKD